MKKTFKIITFNNFIQTVFVLEKSKMQECLNKITQVQKFSQKNLYITFLLHIVPQSFFLKYEDNKIFFSVTCKSTRTR